MSQAHHHNVLATQVQLRRSVLLGVCSAVLLGGSASAAVIGSSRPVDFSGRSVSFGYDGSTEFTFTDVSGGILFNPESVGVRTSGNGAVSVLGAPFYSQPTPTVYQDPKYGFSAQEFGPDAFVQFKSFPTTTGIPYSLTAFVIGLRVDSSDGTHYGYGEFYGTQLVSYAFETQAGLGIQAGSLVSPVPLPASAPMFGGALTLIGLVGVRRKRRTVASAP